MKIFSNKRGKMCIFFKSRGGKESLFPFIPYIYIIHTLKEKYIFP